MRTRFRPFALAVGLLLVLAAPAAAADPAVFAARYWDGFVEYWGNHFRQQNGVVMGVVALGAVALFIITRGKWRK
jgi:cobalamin biosynthesis protein CobD/CbiB